MTLDRSEQGVDALSDELAGLMAQTTLGECGCRLWTGFRDIAGNPRAKHKGRLLPVQKAFYCAYHNLAPERVGTVTSTCGRKDCIAKEKLVGEMKPNPKRVNRTDWDIELPDPVTVHWPNL